MKVILLLQIGYFSSIGGTSAGDTLRKILRKVATNQVLARFSYHGKRTRNGGQNVQKLAFKHLCLNRVILSKFSKSIVGFI
jgi:hypothetical protein